MSENTIKPGDVVFLKSGSPALTVTFIIESLQAMISVEWFDNLGKVRRTTFPHTSLTARNPLR